MTDRITAYINNDTLSGSDTSFSLTTPRKVVTWQDSAGPVSITGGAPVAYAARGERQVELKATILDAAAGEVLVTWDAGTLTAGQWSIEHRLTLGGVTSGVRWLDDVVASFFVPPTGEPVVSAAGTITQTGTGPVTATFAAPTYTGTELITVTLAATLDGSALTVTGGTATIAKTASAQTISAVWTLDGPVGDPVVTAPVTATVPAYVAPTASLAPTLTPTGATTMTATLAADQADGGSAITDRTLVITVNGSAITPVTGLAAEATHTITTPSAGSTVAARVDVTTAAGTTQGATATAQTTNEPVNTALPAITGTPSIGQTLTTPNGTWTGLAPITYAVQWLRDGAEISGATGATYDVTVADAGATLSARVTATNADGDTIATSAGVAVVPVLSGLTLTGGSGTLDATVTTDTPGVPLVLTLTGPTAAGPLTLASPTVGVNSFMQIDSLAAGTYTVTVTQNGVSVSDTVTVLGVVATNIAVAMDFTTVTSPERVTDFFGHPSLAAGTGTITYNATDGVVLSDGNAFLNLHIPLNALVPDGDVTIEIFGLDFNVIADCSIFGNDQTNRTIRGPHIYLRSPNIVVIWSTSGANAQTLTFPWVPAATGTKYDMALVRDGDTVRLYIDGSEIGTGQSLTPGTNVAEAQLVCLGNRPAGNDTANINVKQVRITHENLYAGGGYTPLYAEPSGSTYGQILLAGARTWFNSPQMLSDGGNVLFGAAGAVGAPGSYLSAWNTTTGQVDILSNPRDSVGGDDHDDPGIIKTSAGTYLALLTGHNVNDFYLMRGTTLNSITTTKIQTSLAEVNFSYANVIQTSDNKIHLFGRAANTRAIFKSVSTDDGATWSAYTKVFGDSIDRRPYFQFAGDGDKIHFVLTPDEPGIGNTRLYYGYYQSSTDTFHRQDGTAVTVPAMASAFTEFHDGTNNGWLWDLKVIGGTVYALYTTFPTTETHRYHRAVFSGGTFTTEVLVDNAGDKLYAGQPLYSTGLTLHPTDPNIVYACIEDAGGVAQLNRLNWNGTAWVPTALTNSAGRKFRPRVDDNGFAITWLQEIHKTYGNTNVSLGYDTFEDFAGVAVMGKVL